MVSRGLDLVCFSVIVEYNTTQHEQELAMHRKLIHSVRALGITLCLLTAGIMFADPAPSLGHLPASLETGPAAVEARTAAANTTKAYPRQRRAQARDAMAVPFFSFAQGLRRSKRS
jgi:hypothetical protein